MEHHHLEKVRLDPYSYLYLQINQIPTFYNEIKYMRKIFGGGILFEKDTNVNSIKTD